MKIFKSVQVAMLVVSFLLAECVLLCSESHKSQKVIPLKTVPLGERTVSFQPEGLVAAAQVHRTATKDVYCCNCEVTRGLDEAAWTLWYQGSCCLSRMVGFESWVQDNCCRRTVEYKEEIER